MAMKKFIGLLSMLLLIGCVTMQGIYAVWAVDAQGNELTSGQILVAEGRNIYHYAMRCASSIQVLPLPCLSKM